MFFKIIKSSQFYASICCKAKRTFFWHFFNSSFLKIVSSWIQCLLTCLLTLIIYLFCPFFLSIVSCFFSPFLFCYFKHTKIIWRYRQFLLVWSIPKFSACHWENIKNFSCFYLVLSLINSIRRKIYNKIEFQEPNLYI